ncbi:hypothetical protein KOW79_000159 [Hemibagrus wyckioides]|uniref:Uncharacterized protein n=1 Tax=Hemibagrus wyckioides TaxID=337641 RepID=A0A9D3SS77_9TELE|nr:hypothetical protein KOW79_000159 [Hemibagrus wyckioides]
MSPLCGARTRGRGRTFVVEETDRWRFKSARCHVPGLRLFPRWWCSAVWILTGGSVGRARSRLKRRKDSPQLEAGSLLIKSVTSEQTKKKGLKRKYVFSTSRNPIQMNWRHQTTSRKHQRSECLIRLSLLFDVLGVKVSTRLLSPLRNLLE